MVRLYDAESNQALNAGSVYLNGQPLQQSSTNPQEFTGAVIVPAAGMDVLLEGKFDSAHSVAAHGKILINPRLLALLTLVLFQGHTFLPG